MIRTGQLWTPTLCQRRSTGAIYARYAADFFARYAYEVYIAPKRTVPHISGLYDAEVTALAHALKNVTVRYDNLWQQSFPYVMSLHQAPTDGADHDFHCFIGFLSPLADQTRSSIWPVQRSAAATFLAILHPRTKPRSCGRSRPSIIDTAASTSQQMVDGYRSCLACRWLALIRPTRGVVARSQRHKLLLLRDLRRYIQQHPPEMQQLESLLDDEGLWSQPVDERVVAAIVGVVEG